MVTSNAVKTYKLIKLLHLPTGHKLSLLKCFRISALPILGNVCRHLSGVEILISVLNN